MPLIPIPADVNINPKTGRWTVPFTCTSSGSAPLPWTLVLVQDSHSPYTLFPTGHWTMKVNGSANPFSATLELNSEAVAERNLLEAGGKLRLLIAAQNKPLFLYVQL